jgi:hypothetical protein
MAENRIIRDDTTWAHTQLDMVNRCLIGIGEAPLLDGTNLADLAPGTDADIARRMVQDTMVEVQSRGWWFNTDYDYRLYPDERQMITMPPNTLKVDFGAHPEYRHKYIMRNLRIYNTEDHSYIIPEPVTADVIWLIDYEELPPEAYEYIAIRSMRKFQMHILGATDLSQNNMTEELDALTNLQRLQAQIGDYNFKNPKVSTRTSNAYLIQGLYQTVTRR